MEDFEHITNILDEYQSNKLFSLELRRDLIGQEPSSFDASQELDDDDDRPENVKQMEVDGRLLRTLEFDLDSYETYLSAVEFNWVEAAAKDKFITSAILEQDGLKCTDQQIQAINEENIELESILKDLHAAIEKDEAHVLEIAQELQERYTSSQATYKLSRALTDDIADLELELNELKLNQKEDDSELMTIAEATEIAGELDNQLMEIIGRTSANNEEIPKLKAQYAKESKAVDQLRIERNAIEKAEGDRRRTLGGRIRGSSIAKLESSRTWLTSVTQSYKAAMGILSINASGSDPLKPTKLQIKFGLRHPLTGTLVIEFADSPSLGTRMISASYLDQSSQDISAIVEPFLGGNDVTSLIHAVLHFLVRL
ncbi:hypothetical protein O181_006731 [Austropuccinia psidii MF-1]|uniref:Kinetochore protein Sos7 coiled-coil domain-containing protein n=1 Tax=Austropuccinia psidii MF-1 TaxID=1389203 RepID=A0A9Q3BLF8_9BASI|nr:hypothetical protein [Austropuccinia psidii MF-1]